MSITANGPKSAWILLLLFYCFLFPCECLGEFSENKPNNGQLKGLESKSDSSAKTRNFSEQPKINLCNIEVEKAKSSSEEKIGDWFRSIDVTNMEIDKFL